MVSFQPKTSQFKLLASVRHELQYPAGLHRSLGFECRTILGSFNESHTRRSYALKCLQYPTQMHNKLHVSKLKSNRSRQKQFC